MANYLYIYHDNITFSVSSLISSSVTDSTSSSSITLNRSFFVDFPLEDFLLGLAFAKNQLKINNSWLRYISVCAKKKITHCVCVFQFRDENAYWWKKRKHLKLHLYLHFLTMWTKFDTFYFKIFCTKKKGTFVSQL